MPNIDAPWRVIERARAGAIRWLAGLVLAGGVLGPASASAQQAAAPHPLVFDSVTVIDVVQGRRLPNQRVVIVGTHITTMGEASAVRLPAGARVVHAQGQFLIPGLWDMHAHTWSFPHEQNHEETEVVYPNLLANGITGFRDAGSGIPIDTLRRWQREILAGTRVGPPRQILSGQSIADHIVPCDRNDPDRRSGAQTCLTSAAEVRRYVDSLKAAGADMIKPRAVSRATYFLIAAEARRLGIPFGGHVEEGNTAIEAADSGAVIVDHAGSLRPACIGDSATVAACQVVAAHFKQHGTWFVPTLTGNGGPLPRRSRAILRADQACWRAWWDGTPVTGNWLRDAAHAAPAAIPGALQIVRQAGVPILAGTDEGGIRDVCAIQAELAMYVAEGLTPLEALQTATLNPARFLHATDSMGTVAPGKLADLVLLDADPLADITNTTMIRAVVANGVYRDQAQLAQFLLRSHDAHMQLIQSLRR